MRELRRDLGERHGVVRPVRELGMDVQSPKTSRSMSIGRACSARVGDSADRKFDLAREAFERGAIELRFDLRGDVEKGRPAGALGRLALVKRRDALDARVGAQALQRSEDVRLPVAEVRSDPDIDVHAYRSCSRASAVARTWSSCESPTMTFRKRPWRSKKSCVGQALTPYASHSENALSTATGQTMPCCEGSPSRRPVASRPGFQARECRRPRALWDGRSSRASAAWVRRCDN